MEIYCRVKELVVKCVSQDAMKFGLALNRFTALVA